MDEASYQKAYFTQPAPQPGYAFERTFGVALFYAQFEQAAAFYRQVLGEPGYREGESTLGWQIGDGWLTLLRASEGAPVNSEMIIEVASRDELERLYHDFLAAGGKGTPPEEVLMYQRWVSCSLEDPFGCRWMVIAPASAESAE